MDQKLKELIEAHIYSRVIKPALYLTEHHFNIQDDIANILIMNRVLGDQIQRSDVKKLDTYLVELLEDSAEKSMEGLFVTGSQNKHSDALSVVYLSYVNQLINSISIEILSASYLSANILSRSLLEVLVNVSASSTKSMSKKIESIKFLKNDEQQVLKDVWKELCGWVHSYNRWLKELCPVLVSKQGLHHPELAKKSMIYVSVCIDFSLTLGVELLGLDRLSLMESLSNYEVPVNRFMLFKRRLSNEKS